ncbi:MAG: hypothetical protein ABSE06_04425 [Anaerolineaceae bacterium]
MAPDETPDRLTRTALTLETYNSFHLYFGFEFPARYSGSVFQTGWIWMPLF